MVKICINKQEQIVMFTKTNYSRLFIKHFAIEEAYRLQNLQHNAALIYHFLKRSVNKSNDISASYYQRSYWADLKLYLRTFIYRNKMYLIHIAVCRQVPQSRQDGFHRRLFLDLHGCQHKSRASVYLTESLFTVGVGPPRQVTKYTGCHLEINKTFSTNRLFNNTFI